MEQTPASRDPEVWTDPVDGRLALKAVQACERHSWSLLLAPSEPGADVTPKAVPFACGSWRCRRCGWWVARDDMRRVTRAATSRAWWLYAVLTFDPADFACGWDAYKGALARWHVLAQKMRRHFGRIEYLQTWERHTRRSTLPHVNLIVTGDGLRRAVTESGVERRYDPVAGHGSGRWTSFPAEFRRRWLNPQAVAAGFGLRVWCEVVESADGMAHYLTKAAHDLGASRYKAGDQTPIGAPPHFRRIRASQGLLEPAREKGSGLWTGVITRDRIDGPVAWDDVTAAREAADAARAWIAARPPREPQYEKSLATGQRGQYPRGN